MFAPHRPRFNLLFLALTVFEVPIQASVAEGPAGRTERVLLLGDSWVHVMWLAKSLGTVFAEEGFPEIIERGDNTAVGGTRADQWRKPERLAILTRELAEHPTIDIVHVSLGGNDFFNSWKVSLSDEEEARVLDLIASNLEVVVNHILAQRENLTVLLCGYAYLNFEEPRASGAVPWCAEEGDLSIYSKLGKPTPSELNEGLRKLEDRKAALAEKNPRVAYVNNLGLMQYEYGYSSKGIAPKTVPLPEGDPSLPSPPEALNLGQDCAHLSPEGYKALARNCFEKFYRERFDDTSR
ncbi:MAG: hypothetical protein GHCLOJNM_01890 [bacterium]|nr:hypothetical protein [bacterium]